MKKKNVKTPRKNTNIRVHYSIEPYLINLVMTETYKKVEKIVKNCIKGFFFRERKQQSFYKYHGIRLYTRVSTIIN